MTLGVSQGAAAQSIRVDGRGYQLFFTSAADSSTCTLTSVKCSGKHVAVDVPEFVSAGTHKQIQVKAIGEGETSPFEGVEGVWRISLPASVTEISAFGTVPNLTSICLKAPTPPKCAQFASGGGVLSKIRHAAAYDTLRVPASVVEAYSKSAWGKEFNVVAPLYTFTFDRTRADGVVEAVIASPTNFGDLFFGYQDGEAGVNARTPISIQRTISFPTVNFAAADAKTMDAKLPTWPTIEALSANLKGNNISNLAAKLDGVVTTVRSSSTVSNLVIEDALLYVNPEAETFEKSDDGRTLYVHVLAGRNHGKLYGVGFAGSVVMPKGSVPSDVDKVVVTLVGHQGPTGRINGFLYLETPASQSRGLTYVTECQGVGFDESLASKVAIRKAATKESKEAKGTDNTAFNPDDPRFRYTTCAFSDEEFASGLVAYWLNFRGVGFTGEYKPVWRQGLTHPENENNPTKACYKIDYQFDGESYITTSPTFANGGDRITIAYSRKPLSISVGGQTITPAEGQTTFSYTGDAVVAISWKSADFKPAAKVKEPGIEFTTQGNLITVSGAGKQLKGLYTVTGIKICETTGNTLSAPKRGAYSVKIGKRSWRIFVK